MYSTTQAPVTAAPGTSLRKLVLATVITLQGISLAFGQSTAILPLVPAEIPLDVDAIYHELAPAKEYHDTTEKIIAELRYEHYSHIEFNDKFSSKMLDGYIKALDAGRNYFTKSDIADFEQYRTTLDDLLKKGDTNAGYLIFNRYERRVVERLVYSLKRIEVDQGDFDFTVDESLDIDRSKSAWANDQAALEDLWRRQVKSAVLSLKMTDKTIPEIRELLSKRYRTQLNQALRTNSLDVYQGYMDAMTLTFDPHTQYFAPAASENFNMSMRLSLEGIGASLQEEEDYIKVFSLVSGGPADKTGELRPEDRIIGVAQGDNPFVDVVGWRLDDVVALVRGEKGSVVRLKVNSEISKLETREIRIKRDTVKLEDSAAKSEIVEVEYGGKTHKIGVIDLPEFYQDFEAVQRGDPNFRSATRDVKRLLETLKTQNVEGIVMDLRNNGGGAVAEANALVGLFVPKGATVQVKDADGEISVWGNPNSSASAIYNGPLAVLVNRLSASATEIFAGAIQDYQRGVIVGGQTYGKGTVQQLFPMGDGQLKITHSKFYRISGESTQHKGVTPNLLLPDLFEVSTDVGESTLPTALPWDTIDPQFYRPFMNLRRILPVLDSRHQARVKTDPDFNFIEAEISKAREEQKNNQLTLNETKLAAERKARETWRLQQENIRLVAKGEPPLEDFNALESRDKALAAANKNATTSDTADDSNSAEVTDASTINADKNKEKAKDPYLVESGRVLLDLMDLNALMPI